MIRLPIIRRPMIRLGARSLVLSATLVVGGVVSASRARADDVAPSAAAPSAIGQLTADELAFVRRRLPDFDRRDDVAREKIARNLVRLRALSPVERDRLLARVKRVEAEGGPGATEAAERLGRLPSDKGPWIEGTRRVRAASLAVVAALPPAARELVTPGAVPASIGFTERLQLDVCIAAAWKRRVVEGLVSQPPIDAEPSSDSPGARGFIALRDRVRAAGAAAAGLDDRRKLATAYLEDRIAAARRGVEARVASPITGTSGGASVESGVGTKIELLANALDAAFPGAVPAVAADLGKAISGGRASLKKFCDEAMPERGTPREAALAALVLGLERARVVLAGDLLTKAVELQVALLRELKVPEAELAAFQTATDEKTRLLLLAPLRRKFETTARGPHGEPLLPRDRWMGPRRGAGMSDGGGDLPEK